MFFGLFDGWRTDGATGEEDIVGSVVADTFVATDVVDVGAATGDAAGTGDRAAVVVGRT